MHRSRTRTAQIPWPGRWWPAVLVAAAVLAVPSAAWSAPATQVVAYHGYRMTVPRSWPVFRLAADPGRCVRFDRHAVYLGRPGATQRCPAAAAGRTEAILVTPLGAAAARAGTTGATFLPQPSRAAAAPGPGSSAQLVKPGAGVVVTITWNRDPATIARAVGVRSLAGAAAASRRTPPRAAASLRRGGSRAAAPAGSARERDAVTSRPTAVAAVAAPGGVYTGAAFDACTTPSLSAMAAWGASPYRALGVYIGGANMACSQVNLTAAWVSQQSAAGWSLIPIYVGLQAPGNSCGCAAISASAAAAQGAAAAQDAIVQAQAIGLGPGNPIYDDMEGYSRTSANSSAVLAFLAAWTAQLHAGGYLSGVYSSGLSGIADLVAEVGTGYLEPDDIWVADWNDQQTTSDPSLPAADWPSHQRLHQYSGAHDESYGGQTINIDGDYVDAATAGAGAGAPAVPTLPTLLVKPVAAGTTNVYPHWQGTAGISSWQVLAGTTPTALSAVGTPAGAGHPGAISVAGAWPYVAVAALGADGSTLGTSSPVATPAHVALFGRSAFVSPRGVGGLPVSCFSTSPCRDVITVTQGRTTITTTGPERVPAGGGGLAFFTLSPGARIRLRRAAHSGILVRITVHDLVSGSTASRPLRLLGFTSSGASPLRSIGPSQGLRIIGATDFVSHGWVGGILAGCFAAAPCSAASTLTAGATVIARSRPQVIGVSQLGYLTFTVTAAGHRLLTHSTGNQLGAHLTVSSAGSTAATAGGGASTAAPAADVSATAQIALASF